MILGVTGHRSVRSDMPRATALAASYLRVIEPTVVLTGMAIGWDQAVAEACVHLGIPFRAYLPGDWQASRWPPAVRQRYEELLWMADSSVMCCTGPYDPQALQIRNMAIVDDCDLLLAMWNGMHLGGTWNAIEYATERRAVPRRMVNAWERWNG